MTNASKQKIDTFVDWFISSEYVANWTAEKDSDFINEPDRAERCYDAAEFGADGKTHAEVIEDWRESFENWLKYDHRRGHEYPYRFSEGVNAHFDAVEEWHDRAGCAVSADWVVKSELQEDFKMWYSNSSGRIELRLTKAEASQGSHQGQCDADVMALSRVPRIAKQLAKIDPALLREELKDYGAWDEQELSDHNQNLQRLLWIACGDIVEGV